MQEKIKILNKTVKEVEKGDYTAKVENLGNENFIQKLFDRINQLV